MPRSRNDEQGAAPALDRSVGFELRSARVDAIRRLPRIFALGAALAFIAAAAPHAREAVWPVEGKLLGERKEGGWKTGEEIRTQDFKKSRDVSGLACATASGFPRICLLADDETQGAQIVVLHDGRLVAGDFIRLIDDDFGGEPLELDAEGVAYAEGAFYVAGSHGRPRHRDGGGADAESTAKAAATRKIFRLRFPPGAVDEVGRLTGPVAITPSTALSGYLAAQPELAASFDGALDADGLNVEGIAVQGGRLLAGLRGPVMPDGKAAILSLPLAALFDGAAGSAELHRVDLGDRRGVRDLTAFEGGFLVLAGPVKDPPGGGISAGDYEAVWWDGAATTKRLGGLPSFGAKVKPEALLPLGRANGRLRLLVLFDGPEEGAPRMVEVDLP